MTERLDAIVARCAAGALSANLALMHAILAAGAPGEIDAALSRRMSREADDPLRDLNDLWRRTGDEAWRTVKLVAATADHAAADPSLDAALARWSTSFDALARSAPEAGVALYALGDPSLLARSTEEVVARLEDWGVLGPERDGLEFGCGGGRFVAALAARLRSVTGTDLSGGMIAEARRRCAGLANVRLEPTDGRTLAILPDRAFDLILAVDVFPYLTEGAGVLAVAHWAEAARLLRPGGDFVVLNYSYRGDPARDRAECAALAERHGFAVVRFAEGDFTLWDGATFHLRAAQ